MITAGKALRLANTVEDRSFTYELEKLNQHITSTATKGRTMARFSTGHLKKQAVISLIDELHKADFQVSKQPNFITIFWGN